MAGAISFSGRLTLIHSVLNSIPTYYMSLFPIPNKVEQQLHKLRQLENTSCRKGRVRHKNFI